MKSKLSAEARNYMPKPPDKPRLPSGGEFSPNQCSLRRVLQIASENAGDRAAAEEAIRREYYSDAAKQRNDPSERREQQRKRAGNVLIGMATYGLYEGGSLTALGSELLGSEDDASLYETFARHILKERHGMAVVQAVRNVQTRRETPTKGSLAAELESLGLTVPRATTHHLIMIAWLRLAGVFTVAKGYQIDEARTGHLLGVTLPIVDEWAALTNQQRAVLRVLKGMSVVRGAEAQSAQAVVERVEAEYGRIFGAARDQLRRRIFEPLENGAWVLMSQANDGRGGKSGTIAPTRKLLELDLEALPEAVSSDIPADLRAKLTTPLEHIYADLESSDTYTKGIALELLAIRMATDLGIIPRELRLRGIKTAGAEVDLVAEAVQLHFSRWLFQCKNTAQLSVADLAKELGMCMLLHGHVIVMVTTGRIGATVRKTAATVADSTSYQVVLVDGDLLDAYRKGGMLVLLDFFKTTAGETLKRKRGQLRVSDDTMTYPPPEAEDLALG